MLSRDMLRGLSDSNSGIEAVQSLERHLKPCQQSEVEGLTQQNNHRGHSDLKCNKFITDDLKYMMQFQLISHMSQKIIMENRVQKSKMYKLGFERNHSRFLVEEIILQDQTEGLFKSSRTLNEQIITPLLRKWYTEQAKIYNFIDIDLHQRQKKEYSLIDIDLPQRQKKEYIFIDIDLHQRQKKEYNLIHIDLHQRQEKKYIFIYIYLPFVYSHLHLLHKAFTLLQELFTSSSYHLYPQSYISQHLSSAAHTLRYSRSTLSLRPRAAATKNKMRIAEKAFIYLMQVKNNCRTGLRLQIFLTPFMGQRQFQIKHIFELKFHINFLSERDGPKENQIPSSNTASPAQRINSVPLLLNSPFIGARFYRETAVSLPVSSSQRSLGEISDYLRSIGQKDCNYLRSYQRHSLAFDCLPFQINHKEPKRFGRIVFIQFLKYSVFLDFNHKSCFYLQFTKKLEQPPLYFEEKQTTVLKIFIFFLRIILKGLNHLKSHSKIHKNVLKCLAHTKMCRSSQPAASNFVSLKKQN